MSLTRRKFVAMSFLPLVSTVSLHREAANASPGQPPDTALDPMRLVDPELRAILAQIQPLDLDEDSLKAIRSAEVPSALPSPAVQPKDHFIAGINGSSNLRVVVLDPAPERARKPAILHLHGGGFVAGSPEIAIPELQQLARELGVLVVSVDYRLAPEHPFPAGLDDAYSALVWMHQSAGEFGIDPARIALLGESAGAGLAAALSLRARDSDLPPIRFQALRYPMLDDRTALRKPPSHIGSFIWNWQSNVFAWTSVLGRKPVMDSAPTGAVPARAADLHGLPPTWIGVGMLDLFVEEDMNFAARLVDAGVPVELLVTPGAYHGFDTINPAAHVSNRFIASWKSALGRGF